MSPGPLPNQPDVLYASQAVPTATCLQGLSCDLNSTCVLRYLSPTLQERVKDLETAKSQADLARMMQAQLGGGGSGVGGGQFLPQAFGQQFVQGALPACVLLLLCSPPEPVATASMCPAVHVLALLSVAFHVLALLSVAFNHC